MPFVEHRYGKTYYQCRGRSNSRGLPLICLHGGPGGHGHFMTDLFKLSDERQVFIYDQIGSGRSSATLKKHWTVKTFVDELTALINAWQLDDFHLFGASWGTTLALEYYLKRRKGIKSLVFQSPMFSTRDWQEDANHLIKQLPVPTRKVINYCHEIEATDSKVYQEAMELYYSKHVCRNKTRAKIARGFKNPNGNRIYQHMWGASEFSATGTLKNYDRTARLKNIYRPTLFICGQYDEARPSTARRYAKAIPNAHLTIIPGASHAILAEKPARLIKEVRHFLKHVES